MTTLKKERKTGDLSSPRPLQFLGLLLAIFGFFLALVGFIGIFTGSGGGGIATLVIGGLMTVLGVVLGRIENRPSDAKPRKKGFFDRLIRKFIQFED